MFKGSGNAQTAPTLENSESLVTFSGQAQRVAASSRKQIPRWQMCGNRSDLQMLRQAMTD